tara:strand:- start:604 stop:1449 length:846 start_codon:yes stop_codon:yes gene_type:complete
MSEKSFDERRAALRQRVQNQLENNTQNILDEQSDVLPFEDEQEIVVKPMIDLDYDDRERLRMIVAILVLVGSILGVVSGGILLQGNPDELLNSTIFNEAETVDLTGQILTVDGVTLENATIELYEEKNVVVIQSTSSDQNGYFQFYNVKPEIMEIRVVISGYQSVERTLRAENGLIAPFTMVEGNSSSIIQENTVGSEGGWSLEAAVALSTFLGIVTIVTGFVGIQASVEIRRGKKYRRTQYLAGISLFSRGLIWIGPILILAGIALNSMVKDQYEDYIED